MESAAECLPIHGGSVRHSPNKLDSQKIPCGSVQVMSGLCS
jgi:hypothetical protein